MQFACNADDGVDWARTHGIFQISGPYRCAKFICEPQLADLGRVLEHIETNAHQNRIRDISKSS